MPNEVRVMAEGTLRWVAASASGGGWVTASAPVSSNGPVGFIQAGMSHTSATKRAPISDRGVPSHHKNIGREFGELTITFLEAITANNPALFKTTAGGASLPLIHIEHKATATEDGSAIYRQYHHCTLLDDKWTEGEEGNQAAQTWRFLSMNGPTASGYLG
jgi:hypothetical protein